MVELGEDAELVVQTGLDQGRRDRRQVDADPLAAERLSALMHAVAQPQNGSRIRSSGFELALNMRSCH